MVLFVGLTMPTRKTWGAHVMCSRHITNQEGSLFDDAFFYNIAM